MPLSHHPLPRLAPPPPSVASNPNFGRKAQVACAKCLHGQRFSGRFLPRCWAEDSPAAQDKSPRSAPRSHPAWTGNVLGWAEGKRTGRAAHGRPVSLSPLPLSLSTSQIYRTVRSWLASKAGLIPLSNYRDSFLFLFTSRSSNTKNPPTCLMWWFGTCHRLEFRNKRSFDIEKGCAKTIKRASVSIKWY